MLPVITVIGDQAAALLNGAVVVETIFGFPGVGKLMIDSILNRDFNVILAAIMVTAIAIFVMNLADRPRLRGARSAHPDLSRWPITTLEAKPMTSISPAAATAEQGRASAPSSACSGATSSPPPR